MEAELDQVLKSAKQALQAFEGALAQDVDAALRLSEHTTSQSGALRTKIEDTIQTLHKLEQLLTPPQILFMDGIFAATNTKVLVCASRYRLADILHAHGPLTVPALAARAGVDATALGQLVRYLADEMGVFAHSAATGLVWQNRASELLRADHWTTWHAWVDQYACEHYDTLARLPDAVAAGARRSAAQLLYDTDDSIYRVLERRGATAAFHRAIGAFSVAEAPGLLSDYAWAEVAAEVVADVGAGQGDFVAAYLRRFGDARAVAFELPKTAEIIKKRFEGPDGDGGVRERLVEVRAGDFFVDELPRAPVYFLKFVFHNWDDERCVALLRRLREAMVVKPGVSRVLVVENVIREGRLGSFARYADIRMLSRVRNKERTYEEYRELARNAGFEIHDMITPRGCLTQVLDLRPVSEGLTDGVH